ncbi:MAG: uncharacterized protein JWP02_1001 [Acidimicrobiales bacterium]|nr:uncharacterized protein [Acidimicrobiales bacterium]
MRPPRVLLSVVPLLLLLVACGGGTSNKTTAADATTSSTSASVSSVPTSSSGGGSTTPVSVAPTHPVTQLVAVRTARQQSSDRVVFEFSGTVPGYRVAYSAKPIVGTSGKEVPVGGGAAIVVKMEQASGVDLTGPSMKETYTGPPRLQPTGTQQLVELARVEDFEGVLTWVLGVKSEVPFRVSTLSGPARLVIDLT